MAVKVIKIRLPEYNVEKKPDYIKIGRKVDKILEKSFPNGKYILRAIGSGDHPKLSLDELAEIVIRTGTDKYDSERKAVAHKEFSGYDYDIQAGTFEIKNSKLIAEGNEYPTIFGDVVFHFYEHTPLDRGHAVRVDLLIIYDPKKMMKARKIHPKARSVRKGLNSYLYKFKNRKNKKDALIGIVKILK
ncbi:MAG: hypothetical protein KAS04_02935 [Candidatus Aenigmarchaeota archaeon]|nr:hypothetical protein [Candidatus Aenigmarchaeota archaeon]